MFTTPMVARATYDKACFALLSVPSAFEAQMLRDAEWKGWGVRDAEWKGWSVGCKSYVKALQPARPVGFKVLGAQGPALRDWIVPMLSAKRPVGTPFPYLSLWPPRARPARGLGVCLGPGAGH